MTIEMTTNHGMIDVDIDVLATIAGGAAMDCYGIVGMSSQKQLKDGIAELLKKENLSRGIVIRQDDDQIHVDMYVIVSYGTKISEVAHNTQTKVKYVLNHMLGLSVDSVNIYIQGVQVDDV